jgi:hypothetical protein
MKINEAVRIVVKHIQKTNERPMEAVRKLWANHLHTLAAPELVVLAQEGLGGRVMEVTEGGSWGGARGLPVGKTVGFEISAGPIPEPGTPTIEFVRYTLGPVSVPLAQFTIEHWRELDKGYADAQAGYTRKRRLVARAIKMQMKAGAKRFGDLPAVERDTWFKEWKRESV